MCRPQRRPDALAGPGQAARDRLPANRPTIRAAADRAALLGTLSSARVSLNTAAPARALAGPPIDAVLDPAGTILPNEGALLAAALAAAADGLAMGAYRTGRMLERMLGGATEHVPRHAISPLLRMHRAAGAANISRIFALTWKRRQG